MAKKIISQATYSVTNVQGLPVQVKGQASLVQQTFDKASLDQKTYNNGTLIAELQSETPNDSGANAIGTEGTFGTDNVGDEIKAIKVVTDSKAASADVYLKTETYNQTEVDNLLSDKADTSNVLEKDNTTPYTPTGNYNPVTKEYADNLAIAGMPLYNPLEFYQVNAAGDGTQGSTLPTENSNGVNQALNPIEPSSIVSQLVNVTVPDTSQKKFTLDIQTTVTGGPITINKNGEGALSLKNPDGTNVEELSQDTRFFDIIDDSTVFTLAPKGGAKITIQNVSLLNLNAALTNVAITPVADIDKTYLIVTSRGTFENSAVARAKLTTESNIEVNRLGAGLTSVEIQVIEDSSIKNMQRGTYVFIGGTTVQTQTVSLYDQIKSTLIFSKDEPSSSPTLQDFSMTGSKYTTTSIRYQLGATPTGNKTIDYYLFER